MSIAVKILSISGQILFGSASLILILSPYVDFLKMPIQTIVGIYAGAMGSFIYYFVKKFEGLSRIQNQLGFFTLTEAIALVAGEDKSINKLRIYASTTEVILQIMRDQNINIMDCKILIQIFDKDDPNPNTEELNKLCDKNIKKWNEIKSIKKLDIKRYNRYPTEYLIIADDRYLIRGRYTPDDASNFGSQYCDPIVFSNATVESRKYINESIIWYDQIFKYFENHQDAYFQKHQVKPSEVSFVQNVN